MLLRTSLLGVLSIMAGCTSGSGASTLKVTNGQVAGSNDYPAVVQLFIERSDGDFGCTGTFVGANTILTAAHCVQNASDDSVSIPSLGARSTAILVHPSATFQVMENDLSIILFPDGTAPTTLPVTTVPPSVGDAFTIVGFGEFDEGDNSTAGTKRIGTNQLADVTTNDMLNFFGRLSAVNGGDGQQVSSAEGDSGGPMLINNAIAGTDSGGFNDVTSDTGSESYVNLTLPANQQFFADAISKGANIAGLNSQGGGQADHKVFMLLGDTSDPNQASVYVSALDSVSHVAVCTTARAADCNRGAPGYTELATATIDGKSLYVYPGNITMNAKLVLSVVATDASGNVLSSQSFGFRPI